MSAPVLLGSAGSTVNRKWVPEVNTGTTLAPVWVPLEYVNNFVPTTDDPNLQDSTVFADGGFSGQDKTGAAWNAVATCMRMVVDQSSPPVYGTAQEFIRVNRAIGKFGAANRVQIRFYEFDVNDVAGVISPRTEAYMGFAAVSWAEQGGDQGAESMVQITFTGRGKLNVIAHPYPLTPVVPVVFTAVPGTGTTFLAAGGGSFRITGQGFLSGTGVVATTGVKFIGTNATSWIVWSDWEITGVYPAHGAGSGAVTVTTSIGASTVSPTITYV